MLFSWKAVSQAILALALLIGGLSEGERQPGVRNHTLEQTNFHMSSEFDQTQPLMATDFRIYDKQSNPVNLVDFRGRPVIVNFWASWCNPCKSEMPLIDDAYLAYGDDIEFLIIDLVDHYRETELSGLAYVENKGFSFPIYFDLNTEVAFAYQIKAIPITYFINITGEISKVHKGIMSENDLEDGINAIISLR